MQWYHHLTGPAQIRHTYRDAWTIWELIAPPVNSRLYTLLQLGTAAAAAGLCVRQSRRLSPPRLALYALARWTAWQLVFGPGTERNTFATIAPLTGWAIVAATAQRRAVWLMGLSYLLTLVSAIGGVEDLDPRLKMLHPAGILLFFAWFLWWNHLECGDLSPLSAALRPLESGPRPQSGDESPHSKAPLLVS